MQRLRLVGSVVIAVVAAWAIPLKAVLDFDLDAVYAEQILEGLNPYEHGVVPRPPSAWLLQLPLAWIDTALLSRTTGAAAVVTVSWLSWRMLSVSGIWLLVITGAVAASDVTRVSVASGNMSSVIAILLVIAWARRSGLAVGIAAALRMYPMIHVFAVKRWSTLWTAAALTVAGLMMVPDLGISDLLNNGASFVDHPGNGSAVRFVGLPAAVGIGMVLAWRASQVQFDQAMALTACAAVLVPAVSWPGYHLVLVPALAWSISHGRWWTLAAVPLWFTDGALPGGFGVATFFGALIVLSGVWSRPVQVARSPGDAPKRSYRWSLMVTRWQ